MLRKILFVGLLLGVSAAHAEKYGMAGCGVGSLVFEDKPGMIQIVAGILNDVISPQTSAITSGTSNCYEDNGRAASEMYIEANKLALQEDVSRGQGETLAGLLTIWNCNDSTGISSTLQKNYSQIFAAPVTSQAIKSSMQSTIKNNKNLAAACQSLI